MEVGGRHHNSTEQCRTINVQNDWCLLQNSTVASAGAAGDKSESLVQYLQPWSKVNRLFEQKPIRLLSPAKASRKIDDSWRRSG